MVKEIPKTIIGRVEVLSFPKIGLKNISARIDTGAQTSAIWVSHSEVVNGRLAVIFLDKGHPEYTGKKFYFDQFTRGMVASSNGQTEPRYKIKLSVNIANRNILASFTLADRSSQVYPILVGRNILRGKFVVDVKLGKALVSEEKKRSKLLQSSLKSGEDK